VWPDTLSVESSNRWFSDQDCGKSKRKGSEDYTGGVAAANRRPKLKVIFECVVRWMIDKEEKLKVPARYDNYCTTYNGELRSTNQIVHCHKYIDNKEALHCCMLPGLIQYYH
jgi:hypothetical protein